MKYPTTCKKCHLHLEKDQEGYWDPDTKDVFCPKCVINLGNAKKIKLRYKSDCIICNRKLSVGTLAYWEKGKGVWCLDHVPESNRSNMFYTNVSCGNSKIGFELLPKNVCKICSIPLKKHEKSIVSHNAILYSPISHLRSMSPYYPSGHDNFSETLIKAKYDECYAEAISEAVTTVAIKNWRETFFYNLIVPIPKTIGTVNSTVSVILSRLLSEKLGIKFMDDLLACKSYRKIHQTKMTASERLKLVKEKFEITEKFRNSSTKSSTPNGLSAIIVDDLVTSGSTISYCATLLAKMGIKKIMAISAGRTIL